MHVSLGSVVYTVLVVGLTLLFSLTSLTMLLLGLGTEQYNTVKLYSTDTEQNASTLISIQKNALSLGT